MAQTRLRKTFAYPDSDNDSEPEGLDEQEQEELINEIVEADTKKTENYKRAFLALPALSIILYIPRMGSLTHLLGITSLLSSAYALWILPSRSQGSEQALLFPQESGPLKKYLDHLNASACVILLLSALRVSGDEKWLAVIPTLVFLLLYFARTQLKPVDIRELEKLKYGYKGA